MEIINDSATSITTDRAENAEFNTTHWSVVLRATGEDGSQSEVALESLCRSYWYPLYAYVRRKGYGPPDAQDLTQDFFARLLEKNYVKLAARERGKFRSFLLKSLNHFLINDWVRNRALKRGGGQIVQSLDEEAAEHLYAHEPTGPVPAEILYDKRWALTLLERAMHRLRNSYTLCGNGELFERLKGMLLGEASAEIYREVSRDFGMNVGAVKVAVHRLRNRFRNAVREEVAQTVRTPEEVDEELRSLVAALNQ